MKIADIVFVYQLTAADDIVWHTRHHRHNKQQYEIHYFLKGDAAFVQNDQRRVIDGGTLFITPPGQLHWIDAVNKERPVTYYAVLFEPDAADGPLATFIETTLMKPPHFNIGHNYRYFFEEMKEKAVSPRMYRRRAAAHQLMSLIYTLPDAGDANLVSDVGSVHVERALKMMQENIFTGVSLGDICDKLDLSEAHFIRLFKKKMRITPMKYMTRLKIDVAANLLKTSNRSLAAIAEQLQFSSEFHLSRVFKQERGVPPSVFRKRYRKQSQ